MALIKHMKRCRSEDRYECEQCDQIFSSSEKLQKHVGTEHVFEEEGKIFSKNQKIQLTFNVIFPSNLSFYIASP